MQMSFAPLVRAGAPAVVNICATRIVPDHVSPFASDPFFQDFFGDFGATQSRVQNALGSGVIVSINGAVVSRPSDVAVLAGMATRRWGIDVLRGGRAVCV